MNLFSWINDHSEDIFLFLGQLTMVAIVLFISYLVLRTADLLPGFTFDPFTILALLGVGWYLGKKIDSNSRAVTKEYPKSKKK